MTQQLLDLGAVETRARRPQEPIVRTADKCEVGGWTYRWLMRRAWDLKRPTIFWGMLNPSDADGKRDDPTTWRVIDFSNAWGFGSVIVGNLYPVVSSSPDVVSVWRKTWRRKAWEEAGYPPLSADQSSYSAYANGFRHLVDALDDSMTFVAAWGATAIEGDVDYFLSRVRPYVDTEEFGQIQVDVTWHCLGETASGAPIHPLARGRHRVPNDATLKVWKRRRPGMGRPDPNHVEGCT